MRATTPSPTTSRRRPRAIAVVAALAAAIAGPALGSASGAAAAATSYPPSTVTSWATSALGTRALDASNFTCREIARISLGGSAIRIRLSNIGNPQPTTFGAVSVAPYQGGGAIGGSTPVTFNGGSRSVTIAADATLYSDPIALPVATGAQIAVSLYLPGRISAYTRHDIGQTDNYCTDFGGAAGDHTTDSTAGSFFPVGTVTAWLDTVDVTTTTQDVAIVALGDSLTDGPGRYPDRLFTRLQNSADGKHFAVVNSGIGGNTVITPGGSPTAVSRFDRDVASHQRVRHVILFEGTNDIGAGATAQQVIDGLTQVMSQAHAVNAVVTLATITPRHPGCGQPNNATDTTIDTVNQWIQTTNLPEYKVDFNFAVRNPQSPNCLLPAYDSSDHLHFNDAGNQAIANQVDLRNFTKNTGAVVGPGGTCLDMPGGNSANGTRVEIYDCLQNPQQSWSVIPGGTIRIYGKCLNVAGNATALRSPVQLFDCNLTGGQVWQQRSDGSLLNPQSGLCLDSPNGSTARGTRLQLWTCNGLAAQSFRLPNS